ncbi:MAG: hypothetical protein Q4G69_02710 [Planctomycetia bacterium]|nr:hypothetical protein [Planctomycetia bacterium]
MLRNIMIVFFLVIPLFYTGCGKQNSPEISKTAIPSKDSPTSKESPSADPNLNIDSKESAEGITNQFFKSFFGGDDKTAFALLTPKAQSATRNTFTASANDTIKWKIMKKTENQDHALVYVNVHDLNEDGSISKEELVFSLNKSEEHWGVAGFTAGDLTVSFETVQNPAEKTGTDHVQIGQSPLSQTDIR